MTCLRGLCVTRTLCLRSAMRQALNWRLLLESPVDGIKPPQQSRPEMQALTVEQVRMFHKAALATPHGPALAVADATGMRPSEYLGLKWQDIDWVRQTVHVVCTLRRLNGSRDVEHGPPAIR